jgi:hypothetical protein
MENLAANKESLNITLEIFIKASNRTLVEKITEVSDALNVSRLISNYFAFLMQGKIEQMSATDFLKLFSQGKLPHTESIRRCRQKLQEENPELRGLNYVQRQDIGYQTSKSIKDL